MSLVVFIAVVFSDLPETAEPLAAGFAFALTLWFVSGGFWWVWWNFKHATR
jgi:hypothetical protein